MAIADLLESMTRLADFMDKTYMNGADGSDRIRGQRDRLKEASVAGKDDLLKEILLEVSVNFYPYMLDDMGFTEGDAPEGMTKDEANSVYNELLDDFFFNLLFWETEKNKALKIFASAKRKCDKDWESKHPEDTPPSMRVRFIFGHGEFKGWTDLGKILYERG